MKRVTKQSKVTLWRGVGLSLEHMAKDDIDSILNFD